MHIQTPGPKNADFPAKFTIPVQITQIGARFYCGNYLAVILMTGGLTREKIHSERNMKPQRTQSFARYFTLRDFAYLAVKHFSAIKPAHRCAFVLLHLFHHQLDGIGIGHGASLFNDLTALTGEGEGDKVLDPFVV